MELTSETNFQDGDGVNVDQDSFKKTIEESKAKIQLADDKILPKRGRGQRGPGKKNALKSESHSEQAPRRESSQSPVQAIQPPPSIVPFIKTPLVALSKIPASKYEIPELALTPEEAQICAESLNELVNAFIPDMNKMDPKTAAVAGSLMVFGGVFFQKYTIYSTEMRKRYEGPKVPPEENSLHAEQKQDAPSVMPGGIFSESYFKKR